jgi:hypothetical protein
MEQDHAVMVKEQLVSDIQVAAVRGLALYGDLRGPPKRYVSTAEEAAYRLCHHDFYGLSQGEAAQVLGVTQAAVAQRLTSLKNKAPQLFPILSRNVAAVYNRFTTDNMTVREIADDLQLSPRYCWQVLQDLWENRENTGLYFRTGTRQRLYYRPWMDEHVKECW